MAKMNVKKGDEVIVIAGKDKGKTGKVVQVIPSQDKVVVEGVAIVKRHTKPTQKMPQGGIIEKEAAIHVSNVMPFCSTCKKGVRVAHTIEHGTKTRVSRKCGYIEMASRLKEKYLNEVVPGLQEQFKYTNVMAIPKLDKVVINIGLGEVTQNPKALDAAINDLTLITGQKPVVTKAKKSIAGFKLREGMPVGVKVTLRGDRMYEFVDRLVSVALPRVRDFRGVSPKSFDGRGNYSLGLKEQLIFPEIEYDKIDKIRGMEIVFATTAKTDEEGRALLKLLGMPFAS